MEENVVFMTAEQIEERKAKVAAIEGLAEIRAAIAEKKDAAGNLVRMRIRFYKISSLMRKYPRAAAYLEAERWIATENPVKVRLGSRAMEKILDGEDPYAVIQEMSRDLDAFYLAQEG